MTAPRVEVIGDAQLHLGDCREVMASWLETWGRIDCVVTDPPYHLVSGDKRPATRQCQHAHRRVPSSGFMGQQWDGGDLAFDPATWAPLAEHLKPGAHLLAMGGTRTYHRLVCAIEDAGFEIRDTIAWLYGSGFPKSKNLDGDWQGWGTALKPAMELAVVARKPLAGTVAANVAEHGTGALNIDGCRVATGENLNGGAYAVKGNRSVSPCYNKGMNQPGRTAGRAFKQPPGRWPANVVHDGSPEVMEAFAAFGQRPGQQGAVTDSEPSKPAKNVYGQFNGRHPAPLRGDTGTADRFFYAAKASRSERGEGNTHPTVKPLALMRWFVRMVTPPGGTVLDPFMGSGTTVAAAVAEGFKAIGIERDPAYFDIACRRIEQVVAQPDMLHEIERQPEQARMEV